MVWKYSVQNCWRNGQAVHERQLLRHIRDVCSLNSNLQAFWHSSLRAGGVHLLLIYLLSGTVEGSWSLAVIMLLNRYTPVDNLNRKLIPFLFIGQQPLVGQGLLTVEALRSYDTQHSVELPQDEWSARCRDLYLPTHNIHKRQAVMSRGGIRISNPSKRAG